MKSRNRWIGLLTTALAPLVVIAAPGSASAASGLECLGNSDGSQSDIAGNWSTKHQTQSVSVQQARNTWQDWVWRGPTFQCPWNVPSCSYAWQQSKTTGWKWSAGLKVKLPGALNKALSELAELTPSYERNGSTTTSYTFTTNLRPGQFAQPIQVVERRWTQGVYQGIYHSTGKSCLPSPTSPNSRAWQYTWSPNERWGSWTTNLRVSDYGTYHVWS
ncbi:hypothetical protein [Streptomyces cylindrosporus]|uniref:Secreted protein n=1 Tax=Streptomyces cylindrosporus TaxID=2927583 RepID=A0ABS9YD65_9ACTN|nr:hypothetical protein [Streptomyces cylindrosporus]MCI3274889.1 hypothetical protein [Streptomyces cylindrosporus]